MLKTSISSVAHGTTYMDSLIALKMQNPSRYRYYTIFFITTFFIQMDFFQFLYLISETSMQYVLTGVLCLAAFFLWAQSNAYSRAGSKIRKENSALRDKRDRQMKVLSEEITKLVVTH